MCVAVQADVLLITYDAHMYFFFLFVSNNAIPDDYVWFNWAVSSSRPFNAILYKKNNWQMF